MNAAHERMLRHFQYDHLQGDLREVSSIVCELATEMVELLEHSTDPAEVTVGLRKLLEAKDCFVRAMVK